MVEVCRDARLHDARHVSHRREAARAGSEERQDREAPPLPVQPGDDMSSQSLACWDPNPVEQSQRVAE